MATFYVGKRPVLKGLNVNEMVNPYTTMTGKQKGTGTYSFYPLYSSSHVLDGAPDNHHVPGTGYHPGDVFLSQLFTGSTLYIHPLSGTFRNGAQYVGSRFRPLTFKGLSGSQAFPSGFGHELRYNEYRYNNNIFDGVPSTNVFVNTGHAPRTEAEGAPNSFGLFRPDEPHYVPSGEVFTSDMDREFQQTMITNTGKTECKNGEVLPLQKLYSYYSSPINLEKDKRVSGLYAWLTIATFVVSYDYFAIKTKKAETLTRFFWRKTEQPLHGTIPVVLWMSLTLHLLAEKRIRKKKFNKQS